MKNRNSIMLLLLVEIIIIILMIYATSSLLQVILIFLLSATQILLLFRLLSDRKWIGIHFFIFICFIIAFVFVVAYVVFPQDNLLKAIGVSILVVILIGIFLIIATQWKRKEVLKVIPLPGDENKSSHKKGLFEEIDEYSVPKMKSKKLKVSGAKKLEKQAKRLERVQKRIDSSPKGTKKRKTKKKPKKRKVTKKKRVRKK